MAKFCGNCGSQLDDNARVCGNCGTPVATYNSNSSASISGVEYIDPEKKAKNIKMVKGIASLAVLLVVVIIGINIVSGFVGYKGAVRKIMNAYEDYDLQTIVGMASDCYFFLDDDAYAEEYFENIISSNFDDYELQVGHKYKLSYKITDSYAMSKHKYEDVLDMLSYYGDFDSDTISKVMVVEVEVTAKGDGSMTRGLELTLTKEDGDWRLLYMN